MTKYMAKHIKTGKEYEVVGKDAVGTLIQLKEVGTNIIITTNAGYYEITKIEDKPKLTKTQKIIQAYEDYIKSPFSDGYTRVYLENKFKMKIEKMREIYQEHQSNKRKNLTKAKAYDMIKELVTNYNEHQRMGNMINFPVDDLIEIVNAVTK